AVVLHELAERAAVVVRHVRELDAEADVAQVVENLALHLPPVLFGQRDAYEERLVEERLNRRGLKQTAAAAKARDLPVVAVRLRQPPLDGQGRGHANDFSASFSHDENLARAQSGRRVSRARGSRVVASARRSVVARSGLQGSSQRESANARTRMVWPRSGPVETRPTLTPICSEMKRT